MGNSESRQLSVNQLQQLRRPNISDNEIQQIYTMFINFGPSNGLIDANKMREVYDKSYDKNKLDTLIGDRQSLDFISFYDIIYQSIIEKKNQYGGGVQFDFQEQQVNGLFCQYLN